MGGARPPILGGSIVAAAIRGRARDGGLAAKARRRS